MWASEFWVLFSLAHLDDALFREHVDDAEDFLFTPDRVVNCHRRLEVTIGTAECSNGNAFTLNEPSLNRHMSSHGLYPFLVRVCQTITDIDLGDLEVFQKDIFAQSTITEHRQALFVEVPFAARFVLHKVVDKLFNGSDHGIPFLLTPIL